MRRNLPARGRTTILGLLALAIPALPAAAATSEILLDDGAVTFDYAQYPAGPYAGTFTAAGPIEDPTSFPPGTGACYGLAAEVTGTHHLVVVAGLRDGESAVDAAVVRIALPDPLAPGVYPVDPFGQTVVFGLVDDATGFALPEDPWTADWADWAAAIVATHRFVSMSGTITIETVESGLVTGSFTGLLGEVGNAGGTGIIVSVSGGTFRVGSSTTGLEPATWGDVKAVYQAR
jgi:hypothetical protein